MSSRYSQRQPRRPARYASPRVRYTAPPKERIRTIVVKQQAPKSTRAIGKHEAKGNLRWQEYMSKAGAGIGKLGGQALGTYIGEAAGSAMGGPIGGLLGGVAGGIGGLGLSKIMGFGSYNIERNVFMEGRLPQMMNMPTGGGTIIRFQEYLSDIFTTADIANPSKFDIQSFLINPANSRTFPWLNQIACNYEQYFIEGLVFEFRSTSADALNSTNTALGSVMMATQYDVADPVFRSKAEMLNYEYSNSLKPSDNCMHMVECEPSQSVLSGLYTLDGSAPANTDSRLYHLGRFSIATVGFQAANVNIGELHVTYQIRLLKPKLYAELGLSNDWALLTSPTYSNTTPLSGTFTGTALNNLEVTVSGGTCTLPVSSVIKTYRVEIFWIGSVAAAIGDINSALTVANCTLNSFGAIPTSGTSGTSACAFFAITTNGNSAGASFSFSSVTLPVTPTSCVIRIMQVPQGSGS